MIQCSSGTLIPLLAVRFYLISFIFKNRSWLSISFLHISTRSLDWRNKNWVSCFSRFNLRVLYMLFIPKNEWNLKEGFYWAIRAIWSKYEESVLNSHYWSRIITELWRFQSRYSAIPLLAVRFYLRLRYFSKSIMTIYKFLIQILTVMKFSYCNGNSNKNICARFPHRDYEQWEISNMLVRTSNVS